MCFFKSRPKVEFFSQKKVICLTIFYVSYMQKDKKMLVNRHKQGKVMKYMLCNIFLSF